MSEGGLLLVKIWNLAKNELTLITGLKSIAEGREVCLIRQTDDEFYLVENRQWNGWQTEETCVDEVTLFDDISLSDIVQHEDGTVSFTFHASSSGIFQHKAEPQASGVYTLSGVKLRDDGRTEGLPKGVYIVNGRKIVH